MQRITNNGSFLQAYALYKILQGYGHEVEFIDYNDDMHTRKCIPKTSRFKCVFKWIRSLVDISYKKDIQINNCTQDFFPSA